MESTECPLFCHILADECFLSGITGHLYKGPPRLFSSLWCEEVKKGKEEAVWL